MKKIQLIQLSEEELINLINNGTRPHLENLVSELLEKHHHDDLLTREATSKFLDVDLSTLARWTKNKQINCWSISGRRYYKRSEIMESLKKLK